MKHKPDSPRQFLRAVIAAYLLNRSDSVDSAYSSVN